MKGARVNGEKRNDGLFASKFLEMSIRDLICVKVKLYECFRLRPFVYKVNTLMLAVNDLNESIGLCCMND